MRSLNIAICGCGPAGLAAALFLRQQEHRIVLIDRFAEPKPLGSGLLLQPGGMRVLQQLGVGTRIGLLGAPVTRLFGTTARSDRTVLDVSYGALGPGLHAVGLHRSALFYGLFRAAQSAAADIETGFEVAGLDRAEGGRPILLGATGRRLGPFDLLIDALGSRSAIADSLFGSRWHRPLAWGALWASLPWPATGFDPQTLEQRYARANRMIGVLPTGRRTISGEPEAALFWSLKASDHARWQAAGLDAWKDEVMTLWPQTELLLGALTNPDQLTFARYGHHTLPLPIAHRMAIIGDAAHATSPQLGQGANMALLDASALGQAIAAHDQLDSALAAYARIRRWHVRLYQALGAVLTPFYQSDSTLLPALRDHGFAAVSALPGGRRLLASLVAGLWLGRGREFELNRSGYLTYPTE